MRQIKNIVSAVALMVALASTAQASQDAVLGRRNLQSEKVKTQYFNNDASTYAMEDGFVGAEQVGLILGFCVTGIFLLYAAINIIIDECQRHKKYSNDIEEDKRTLRLDFDISEQELTVFENEFKSQEAKRGQQDDEAEMKALQEIN